MSIAWYSIQIRTIDGGPVDFDGFFSVNTSTNLVQNFYDSTNPTADILSTGNNGGPTYLYLPGWLCFDGGGCNITSVPFLYGSTTGDYNMYGNPSSSQGSIDGESSVFFTFSPLSGPPTPTSGVVCFKEGSKILTNKGYIPIQELRKGDLVQTYMNDYKAIYMIGKRDMIHVGSDERIKDQLYVCTTANYPELLEDLVITGCHSILVSNFKEEEEQRTRDINGDIYVTDKKYRLPACVDMRATVYEKKGVHTIYHIALENDDYYMNYGVYANGLLVETCSKRYLKELSNMTLIE